MGQKINVSISVQIAGGSNLPESQVLDVDAVDNIDIELDKKGTGGAEKSVDVQPSELDKVKFLMLSTKSYDGKVSYQIPPSPAPVKLDGPLVLIGLGAVSLLDKAPQKIKLTNDGAEKVSVKIVVGRTAT